VIALTGGFDLRDGREAALLSEPVARIVGQTEYVLVVQARTAALRDTATDLAAGSTGGALVSETKHAVSGGGPAADRPDAASMDRADRPSKPERRYDVDLIRILATLAVIVLHTSHLVDKVTPGRTSSGHYITLVADAAGRFAVPAFFAMAGWAVLVASPPRDGATVGRRLVRILVPMAVWTAGYIAFVNLNGWYAGTAPKTFAVDAAFGQILPAYHLWYLYAYVPLILLLSIAALLRAGVRPIVPAAAVLVVGVAAGSGPAISHLTGWDLPRFDWVPEFYQLAYAVGGAVLLALPRIRMRWIWWLLALAGLAGTMVWEQRIVQPAPYGVPVIGLLTLGLLAGLSRVRIPVQWRRSVVRLSEASFGVYLVHLMILQTLTSQFLPTAVDGTRALVTMIAFSVATAVAAYAISLAWGRLNLRRLLG
jgi:surface polysaccharide O-acyltransferase-like enzyme